MTQTPTHRTPRAHRPHRDSRPAVRPNRPAAPRWRDALAPAAWLLLAALGPAAAAAPAGRAARTPEPGAANGPGAPALNVRAHVSCVLPDLDEFVLEATLPVPPGTLLDPDGPSTLAIARGGAVYPTQVEIVSRYPDPADGADVVELIARVPRPSGAVAGAEVQFDVVEANQPHRDHQPRESVRSLIGDPDGIIINARDPFGNYYSADLAAKVRTGDPSVRVLRDGAHLRELRSHCVMLPGSNSHTGPTAPYPHLFGVHTFWRTYSGEDFVVLELLVHNGMVGGGPGPADDPVHDLYFNQLDVVLPGGWTMGWAHDNPAIGRVNPAGPDTSVAIVDRMSTGQYHMAPQQSQFVRRLVIANDAVALDRGLAVLRRETRGFCVPGPTPAQASVDPTEDPWSWWNAGTARFLATNDRLPHLDHMPRPSVIGSLDAMHSAFADQVATGAGASYPREFPLLGWAQPWGVQYGGMTGGDEIAMHPGVEAAWARHPVALQWLELRARAYVDRHPVALFDVDGNPPTVEGLLVNAGGPNAYVPMEVYLRPLGNAFGLASASKRIAEHAYNAGVVPWYQKDLARFQPIDLQHLTRFLSPHLGLVWLANDSIAKLELELNANLFHLSFHQYPNGSSGYVQGTGLLARINEVNANPGQGARFGRGEAWGIIAATSYFATADEEERSRLAPWFALIADTARRGQSTCTGNPTAIRVNRNFKGAYQSRQSFEVGFFLNAAEAIRSTVFEGVRPASETQLAELVRDGAYSCAHPPFWSPNANGQLPLIAVRPFPNHLPEFCTSIPENGVPTNTWVDHTTAFPSWAYAYDATTDGLFLTRATAAVPGTNLIAGLQSFGLGQLPDIAPILSLAQEL